MTKRKSKGNPLEDGLISAMRAIDNQIAREMQRSPEELSVHGVRKDEPINERSEQISAFLLRALGERRIELDSLLVLCTATVKSLQLMAEDLGNEGLGKMRTEYCLSAAERIERDIRELVRQLEQREEMYS